MWLLAAVFLPFLVDATPLRVGVGIADVTGPPAEINFMGYGAKQKGTGIHLRQFARAFIFDDGVKRLVFVSIDSGMVGYGLRNKVLRILDKKYDGLYTEQNVMLSGTHSHSTPGGHLLHMLYDISILGFSQETFNAFVTGIAKSIMLAHDNIKQARVDLSKGELLEANINRSPTAYQNNPHDERQNYKYNVDKDMVMLKIRTAKGAPMGAISWFAVHPTSMNNTNTLVSSDNVGYASVLLEQFMNPHQLIGKGPFVSAFASTNLGDVSPNTGGPRCMHSGKQCDEARSTCDRFQSNKDECVASGPGHDMFESTHMIAQKLFGKAKELWDDDGFEITGPLKVGHQFLDVPSARIQVVDPATSSLKWVQGCVPAMGYSFGAGTTDGPGASIFSQSTTSAENPLWNALRDFLVTPRQEDINCHAPKPILLPTGRMTFPYEWQPRIVSTQVGLFQDLALVCVPAEFTTMSGRRLRRAIAEVAHVREVVIVGVCNTYSSYVATYEEYQVQRYEGASTIFGPHTLDIYLHHYKQLTQSVLQDGELTKGPDPVNLMPHVISLIPPVIYDTAKWSYDFGNVTLQPKLNVRPGDTVTARFISGHPRNDIRHGDTFLTVEKLESDDVWTVVATDANWETKYRWIRQSDILGTSEALIEWTVPFDTTPGQYRIRHFGTYKYVLGGKFKYEGTSRLFNEPPTAKEQLHIILEAVDIPHQTGMNHADKLLINVHGAGTGKKKVELGVQEDEDALCEWVIPQRLQEENAQKPHPGH